jgi:hypothetical protein
MPEIIKKAWGGIQLLALLVSLIVGGAQLLSATPRSSANACPTDPPWIGNCINGNSCDSRCVKLGYGGGDCPYPYNCCQCQ